MTDKKELAKKLLELNEKAKELGFETVTVKQKNNDNEEDVETLREQLEDYRAKLQLVAEEKFNAKKKTLEKEAQGLGIPVTDIEDPSQLKMLEQQIEQKESSGSRSRGSGTANLRYATNPDPERGSGYSDYAEMIQDLQRKEALGDTKSKKILDEFMRRSVNLAKTRGIPQTHKEFKFTDPETGEEIGPIEAQKREFRKRKLIEKELRDSE